ncbi:MAG: hypothetical protein SCALA701_13550 [Candidatus Scalindua sp.]|nr:MAG: hypothetical protein SCALA701_13550 [Candidatus Scalindua sp.]
MTSGKKSIKILQSIILTVLYLLITLYVTVPYATAGTETYEYDNLDRLMSVTYDNGLKISYTYDSAGNILMVKAQTTVTNDPRVTIGNKVTCNIGNTTMNVPYNIVNNGALVASTGTINAGGNWVNNGTFVPGTGAVNFVDGQSPVSILGNSYFYELSAITSTGKQLNFDVDNTQTVSNSLSLRGSRGNLLYLRSTNDGRQAKVDLQGGIQVIDHVDVKDNSAIGQLLGTGTPSQFNSIDSGNNSGWFQVGLVDTDGDGIPDSIDPDDDNDGMEDVYEEKYGLNPLVDDSTGDLDGDGIKNLDEYKAGKDPTVMDIVHVDFKNSGVQTGTVDQPYDTVKEAVEEVSVGGEIKIKAGKTDETPVIKKEVIIDASGGEAVIGE